MSRVLVNSSSGCDIFSISDGETKFKNSVMINATVDDGALLYDYNVNYMETGGFLRLRVNLKYIVTAKETNTDLIAAELTRDFEVVRRFGVLDTDLFNITNHCIDLMNSDKEKETYPEKYLPEKFKYPVWEVHKFDLVQTIRELNDR